MKMDNNNMRPVVFLDRDGTLNEEAGYIRNVEDLVLIKGAAQSVKRLNDAGIATVLVTNQSGAARKFYPESHIGVLHERLKNLLAEEGAFLDAIYYCPHLSVDTDSPLSIVCDCRKPATGMVDLAYSKYPQLNRQDSFMVGDKISDIELALNCQARSILVKTGYGESTLEALKEKQIRPDFIAQDIVQAVDWILSQQ
jgi:D-glycero-D-manno-heptose 1,7-bisphosphate phosphatase